VIEFGNRCSEAVDPPTRQDKFNPGLARDILWRLRSLHVQEGACKQIELVLGAAISEVAHSITCRFKKQSVLKRL
jgi:hypothetical protein